MNNPNLKEIIKPSDITLLSVITFFFTIYLIIKNLENYGDCEFIA